MKVGNGNEERGDEQMKDLYVIKTDRGYITGDMINGVVFVDKGSARKFDLANLNAYWDSIAADMFQFYNVKELEAELA